MDDDAHIPSLSARIRLLERLVKGQAAQMEADRRKIAELARARAQEIVWDASTSPPSPRPAPPPPRRHKRPNPHGLHIVPGFVAAGVAWVAAKRIRQVVTAAAAVATVATGAVTPSVITPGSPATAKPVPSMVRHHHQTPVAPQPQPSRKKRQPVGRNERNTPSPSPSNGPATGGTPAPSPLPTVSPMPTVPSPTPTPAPTPPACLPPPACHPLHVCCDKGDGDSQLLAAGRVMQTRAWLISKHRLRLAA